MTKDRLPKPAGGPTEPAESGIKRLASANARAQAEIKGRLAGQGWEADRVIFRAMIDQVPDYLFVKDTRAGSSSPTAPLQRTLASSPTI